MRNAAGNLSLCQDVTITCSMFNASRISSSFLKGMLDAHVSCTKAAPPSDCNAAAFDHNEHNCIAKYITKDTHSAWTGTL
jgi:hypothetical protein